MVFAYHGVQMKRIRISLALGFAVLFSFSGYAQETWTSRGDNIITYRYKNVFSAGPLTIALEDSGKYLASADGNTWTEGKIEPRCVINSSELKV
jgi:hypothetical protein